MSISPRLHNGGNNTINNSSNSNRFWLEFRVVSDGFEMAAVSKMRAAAVAGGAPDRFPLFPDLPAEIRLKIWEYLIAPRVVAVACLDAETASSQREDLLLSRPARPAVPVLLHVCHEARTLALSHYELSFAWKVPLVLAGMDLPVFQHSSHPHSHSSSSSSSSSSPEEPPYFHSSSSSSAHAHAAAAAPPTTRSPAPPTWSRPRVWFNFALDTVYLVGELEPCDSFGFNSPMAYFLDRQEARRVRRAAVAFSALRYGEAGVQQIFGSLFHVVDRFPPADGRVLVTVTPADEYTHALMGGEGPLVPFEGEEGEDRGQHGEGDANGNGGVDWDGVEVMEGRSSSVSYHNGTTAAATAAAAAASSRGIEAGGGRRGAKQGQQEESNDNVLQKIWNYWYRGSIVKSSLANTEFVLVREADLEKNVLDWTAASAPPPPPPPPPPPREQQQPETGTERGGSRNSGGGGRTTVAT
ncbi:hypothetical protein F5X96DRAFT_294170 [Biscogniauxia mediterranea]|nr:hypothetical protein F5X96DRAFT_294170 [Biscogniauxia mediterranea]